MLLISQLTYWVFLFVEIYVHTEPFKLVLEYVIVKCQRNVMKVSVE